MRAPLGFGGESEFMRTLTAAFSSSLTNQRMALTRAAAAFPVGTNRLAAFCDAPRPPPEDLLTVACSFLRASSLARAESVLAWLGRPNGSCLRSESGFRAVAAAGMLMRAASAWQQVCDGYVHSCASCSGETAFWLLQMRANTTL